MFTVKVSPVAPILAQHVAPKARLMIESAQTYKAAGKVFASHNYVDHARGEYVRKGNVTIHTNTIEGFFGIFKRGIYQDCGSQHLQRYMAEFDFRYTNRSANGIETTSARESTCSAPSGSASPIGGLVASHA